MITIEQLRKPLTKAQALDYVVGKLTALGFDTTDWQDGAIQKTIVMTLALVVSDFSEIAKALAEFGFNTFSRGDPLNDFSWSRYRNRKVAAVKTRGPMTLRSTASIPYTIKVGELIVSTDAGVQFRNATGGTISAGTVLTPSTLSLTFEAVKAGASGNVAKNSVTRMITPLAGVSVLNDTGTPWYTTTGADEEGDASIQARNSAKWTTLSVEYVAEAYEKIARDAGAKKVKVHDANPRGPGTLDVYAAGDTGLLGTSDMQAIQLAFSKRAFSTDATWVTPWTNTTSRVATKHPSTLALDVVATLYHDASVPGSVIQDRARTALTDFVALTPIGGWDFSPGPANIVKREDVVDVLKRVTGVRTVDLATPSTSPVVGPLALVIEGTWTLNVVAVS